MSMRRVLGRVRLGAACGVLAPCALAAQSPPTPSCTASATSLTPATWRAPAQSPQRPPAPGLRIVATIPLPGPTNRFDYQSFDDARHRLYINHMNAGHLLAIDVDSQRVTHDVGNLPRATGVWAVPAHHEVYVAAAGAHAVVVLDDRTLDEVARVDGIRFPDGIAYASGADKVFVSDESGRADVVIDAVTHRKRSTIDLGGEAGNTHYDSVSRCILVAVQTRNELVAIDPVGERIVARYRLPGFDHPHGFTLDEVSRLAFVTNEGSGEMQVVDLRTMRVLATHRVGDDPDVLAWDPVWRRLYVAAESGVVSSFWLDGTTLHLLGEYRAPSAHSVSVDPRTHRIYVPLENVGGHPALRILEPNASPPR
jgi:DNA-binding beta-propeller fold protein YncE